MSMPFFLNLGMTPAGRQQISEMDPTLWAIPVLEQLQLFEGWCHMDLRMGNILIENDDDGAVVLDDRNLAVVHLIDFDFAREHGETHDKAKHAIDTPPDHFPRVKPTSDMWALALTILRVLTDEQFGARWRETPDEQMEQLKASLSDLARGQAFSGRHRGSSYDTPALKELLARMLADQDQNRETVERALVSMRGIREATSDSEVV